MNKILKSKKGISPILATLLLIVIAVAAVIVTYAWVMTFTTSQTQQAGAILSVENVYFSSTPTETIAITLRNSGSADAKIADVYAGASATAVVMLTSGVTYSPTNQIVTANGGSITMTITYDFTNGTKVYFKVATEAGQTIPFDRTP